jgi:hypothetical protein
VSNEWCWHLFINQVVALILGDEEGMGDIAFNIVIVVDWDIYENAVVKAERASLFRFDEDIPTHIISVGQ